LTDSDGDTGRRDLGPGGDAGLELDQLGEREVAVVHLWGRRRPLFCRFS